MRTALLLAILGIAFIAAPPGPASSTEVGHLTQVEYMPIGPSHGLLQVTVEHPTPMRVMTSTGSVVLMAFVPAGQSHWIVLHAGPDAAGNILYVQLGASLHPIQYAAGPGSPYEWDWY